MHVLACLASLAGMASHNLARATKGPIFRRDEIAGWLAEPFLFPGCWQSVPFSFGPVD